MALDTNRIWLDATPTTTAEPTSSLTEFLVTEDIIETVTQGAIQGGALTYYVTWYPIGDSSLAAA